MLLPVRLPCSIATSRRAVFLGDLTQAHVEWCGRELVIRQTAAAPFAEGKAAWFSIDRSHCVLLEPD